ncbi:hypothetical protein [Streptomyces adustus]
MKSGVLGHTVCILGVMHAPEALPMTEDLLNHSDHGVREEARLAAAEITASDQKNITHSS